MNAAPLLRRTVSVFLLTWVAIGAAACERESPSSEALDPFGDRDPTGPSIAVSQAPAAENIDSAAVTTMSRMERIESMGELMRLVRYLTYWHNGNRRVILLHFRSDGYAIDDSGNSVSISAAQWKGMVQLIEITELKPMPILTTRPTLPDDLGRLPKLVYEIETDDDARIQFTCLGPYEG